MEAAEIMTEPETDTVTQQDAHVAAEAETYTETGVGLETRLRVSNGQR